MLNAATMPDNALYVYRARMLRVIDGDTLELMISLGLHDYRVERIRLLGVNTPERRGATKAAGLAAMLFVENWLAVGNTVEWPLIIRTEKSDSFGRFLADVWRMLDRASLNEDLLVAGYAVIFR